MKSFEQLAQEFRQFDLNFSQADMQAYLATIYKKEGLNRALDLLFEWELAVGYITPGKLNDNKRYRYEDPVSHIVYRTQVNIARSNYSPKPISGASIPKLHCPICIENLNVPGKEDLRVFEFELSGKPFFTQLTPFPLFPQHYVLIDRRPTPMIMDERSVIDMVNFESMAPGYTVLSNSDVEWAGASVLVHHHYQAMKHLKLPIMEAQYAEGLHQSKIWNSHEIEFGLLDFPIAACVLKCRERSTFIKAAGKLIMAWRDLHPQNTCNLAFLRENDRYQIYIIYRNPDHRTPEALTRIKSEGVGIVEVCGEGIYPVPKGEGAEALWNQIEKNGLAVIKGIIAGNNPVPAEQYSKLFERLSKNLE
ncbi:MAG: hypothetical protein EBX40_02275 [Gammaproteobacteria bacterium]|nr:hypothetical protein [Gammaproteobacteria bacterium]